MQYARQGSQAAAKLQGLLEVFHVRGRQNHELSHSGVVYIQLN